MQINYKSDFDFILELRDSLGQPIGWPNFDWTLFLKTPGSRSPYVAFRRGNVLKGCFEDKERIHIVADGHGLGPGRLSVEFVAEVKNPRYPDGCQRIVIPEQLNIFLTDRSGVTSGVEIGDVSICLPAVATEGSIDEETLNNTLKNYALKDDLAKYDMQPITSEDVEDVASKILK